MAIVCHRPQVIFSSWGWNEQDWVSRTRGGHQVSTSRQPADDAPRAPATAAGPGAAGPGAAASGAASQSAGAQGAGGKALGGKALGPLIRSTR